MPEEIIMGMASRLGDYLKANAAQYEVLSHPHSSTSMQTALASNVPADRLAKAVVLEDGEHCLMAVLPASRRLKLWELQRANGRVMHLAAESELKELFSDCEPGAVPPLGVAYGMDTVWDDSLMAQPDMYFEAGDHETLIHMKTRDFIALMKGARHMPFSATPEEGRGPLF